MCANSSLSHLPPHKISYSITNLERKKEILGNKSSIIDRINQTPSSIRIKNNTTTTKNIITNQFQSSKVKHQKYVVIIKYQDDFKRAEHQELFLRNTFSIFAKANKEYKIKNKCREVVNQVLIPSSLSIVKRMSSRSISNIMHSYARLKLEKNELFISNFADAAITTINEFSSQSIANLAWAFAKLNMRHPVLFKELADAAIAIVDEFSPQGIVNLAWAFAMLNIEHSALFKELATVAIAKIDEFSPQGIANLAWAFAKLNIEHPALFKKLATVAIAKIDDFNPQNIANLAWAFAKLNIEHPALFKKLADTAIAIVDEFSPQGIVNLAWAFAMLNIEHPALFKKLATVAIATIDDFNPQGIVNLAWAFAMLNIEHSVLFKKLATVAIAIVDEFSPQGIANLAWAFAKLNIEHPVLFKELATAAIVTVDDFNLQNIANLAWAFAKLDIEHPALFKELADAAIATIDDFNPQEITNLAWAIASQNDNFQEFETFFLVLMKKLEIIPSSKFNDMELSQLNTVRLMVESRKSHLTKRIEFDLPISIKEAICLMLDKRSKQRPSSSKTHLSLSSDLNKLLGNTPHCNEFFIEGFFLDIAFIKEKVAIEIDGSTHFLNTLDEVYESNYTSYRGHDKIKNQILNSLGWHVLHISTKSLNNPVERKAFLNHVKAFLTNKPLKKDPEEEKAHHRSSPNKLINSSEALDLLKELNETKLEKRSCEVDHQANSISSTTSVTLLEDIEAGSQAITSTEIVQQPKVSKKLSSIHKDIKKTNNIAQVINICKKRSQDLNHSALSTIFYKLMSFLDKTKNKSNKEVEDLIENTLIPICLNVLETMDSKAILSIILSYAELNLKENKLFSSKLIAVTIAKINEFDPEDLPKLAFAFVILNIKDDILFKNLITAATIQINEFNTVQLADLACVFAYQNENPLMIKEFIVASIKKFEAMSISKLGDSQLLKFHAAQLMITLQNDHLKEELQFPITIQKKLNRILDQLKRSVLTCSSSHLLLSSSLNALLKNHTHHNKFFIEGFILDIAFVDQKVAIELNEAGFPLDIGSRIRHNLIKNRLLNLLGWQVLRIDIESLQDPLKNQQFLNQVEQAVIERSPRIATNKEKEETKEAPSILPQMSATSSNKPEQTEFPKPAFIENETSFHPFVFNDFDNSYEPHYQEQAFPESEEDYINENDGLELEDWNEQPISHFGYCEDLVSHPTELGLFDGEYWCDPNDEADSYDQQDLLGEDYINENDGLELEDWNEQSISHFEYCEDLAPHPTELGLFDDEYWNDPNNEEDSHNQQYLSEDYINGNEQLKYWCELPICDIEFWKDPVSDLVEPGLFDDEYWSDPNDEADSYDQQYLLKEE